MKRKQLIPIAFLIVTLVGFSSCATKKKKKKCDTCPTWGYVSSK
ncbi:MAG: hypothetical protein ABF264_06350 [Flavobacteriales bacterium]